MTSRTRQHCRPHRGTKQAQLLLHIENRFELNHLTLLPWTLLIRYPSLWAAPNHHSFQVGQFHSLSAFLFPHEPAHTHHCATEENRQCVTNTPLPDGPPSCGTGSINSTASPSISWANSANLVNVSEIQGKARHQQLHCLKAGSCGKGNPAFLPTLPYILTSMNHILEKSTGLIIPSDRRA